MKRNANQLTYLRNDCIFCSFFLALMFDEIIIIAEKLIIIANSNLQNKIEKKLLQLYNNTTHYTYIDISIKLQNLVFEIK